MKPDRNLLRAGLTLALSLFTAAWAVAAQHVKPGVERWPIKTSLAPHADVAHPKQVDLVELLNLEDPPGVAKDDPRYQSQLIPAFPNSLDVKEGDIITTKGWLHVVAGEADGDYHIQISDSRDSGNRCLIVEAPKNDPAFVADPAVRALTGKVRKFIFDKVLQGKDPAPNGTVVEPVFVKVTGQLFYDDAHVGDPPRGKKGMKAATLWELHPLTDVKLAHPPAQ